MKSIFILLLALLVSVQSYAGTNGHDKQPFNGSTNKIFTPLEQSEQQALSMTNPAYQSGNNKKMIERVSWVKVNMAELDALRSYASDVLAKSENNLIHYKSVEGQVSTLRIKQHLDFPVDINFNFFNDIEFSDLYLGEINKTVTKEGEIYYTLALKQRDAILQAVYVELKDEMAVYTSYANFYVRLEQVGKHHFRVNLHKTPKLIEEDNKTSMC